MTEVIIKEVPDFMQSGYQKSSNCFIARINGLKKRKESLATEESSATVATPRKTETTIIMAPKKSDINIEDSFFKNKDERKKAKKKISSHRNTAQDKQELEQYKNEILHFFYLDRPELSEYYNNEHKHYNEERKQMLPKSEDTYFRMTQRIYNFRELKKILEELGIDFHASYPLNGEIGFITAKRAKTKS